MENNYLLLDFFPREIKLYFAAINQTNAVNSPTNLTLKEHYYLLEY